MDHAASQRIVRHVNYSFYSALCVVLLVIILFFASLYTQKWIVHTNEVKGHILSVSETLLRAENLHRGYLLSKDAEYRIDYKVTLKDLRSKFVLFEEKVSDNTSQLEDVEEFKRLIEERISIMDNNLENYIVGTAAENRSYKNRDEVKKIIADIKDTRDSLLSEENRLLAERKNTYDTIYNTSLIVLALGLILMIYSLYMLRKRLLPLFNILAAQNDDLIAAITDKEMEITLKEEQVNLNKELIHQLEEKNVQLNQFAYIASHDLQEPLRTVDNFIDLFEEDYGDKLDAEAGQYFSFIKGATSRMNMLITGLLNYSRLGKSGVKSKVELNKLIEEIKADFSTRIEESNAIITYDKLPTVSGFPLELRQLFANLISNALKFMPADKQPKIHIICTESSKFFTFKIKDNGLGIKKEHISKIFNMFTRLHSAKEYKGTGIGLAFCQKIVDLHQGTISVESALGTGSTFTFTLKK